MNVLSLFSGIGGLELGLERAGMTVVGQVEIDPFCRSILHRHWPHVPQHDDVRTAVDWWLSESRPHVDIIAGGFPCQPFSHAGLRKGITDDRWGWPWMRDVIDTVRPRFILVENVAALLRDAEAFSIILGDLSDLGFDVEWDCVSACSLGAPHTRERLFVLAHPDCVGERFGGRLEFTQDGDTQRHVRHWSAQPEPHRVADGIPRQVDRNHALGNAVVPQVSEYIGRQILDAVKVVA